MKAFELVLPKTLDQAGAALPLSDEFPERNRVKLVAGGQDLYGEMKDHLVEPDALVNLKSVPGLDTIEKTADGVSIGALVTLETLERDPFILSALPMLAEGAAAVASPQIRSVGTIGGNLCQRPRCLYYRTEHAPCLKKGGTECFAYGGFNKYNAILGGGPSYIVHPSDVAPALVAYGATVTLSGPTGERTLPLEDFYVLPSDGDPTKESVLLPNEIMTKITIPSGYESWKATYMKVRERDAFDFALSAIAMALRFDGDRVSEARMVLGGVAPKPWRCASTEAMLAGKSIDDETCRAAGEDALSMAEPLEHNAYKIPMTKGLITKALRRLSRS